MADPYFWAKREDQPTIKDITTFASASASQVDSDGPPKHTVLGFQSGKYDVYVSAGLNGEKQGPAPHTRIAPIRSQRPDTPSPDREVTLEYIDNSNAIKTDGGNKYTPYEIRDENPASEGQTVRVPEIIDRTDGSAGMVDDPGNLDAPRIVEGGSVITTNAGRPALRFADGEAIGGGEDNIATFLIVCEITSACDISNATVDINDPLTGDGGKLTATPTDIRGEFPDGTVLKRSYTQGERVGIVVAADELNDQGALAVNGNDVTSQTNGPNQLGFVVGGPNASGFKFLGGLAYFGTFLSKSKREQLSGIYA